MKRLPAILFFFILVFNFVGYRMVIAYMQAGNTSAIEKKLDQNDYRDEELVSIKTKLNLPYYSSSKTFERSYGSITINGMVYEYVKQRVYNDTLELLCLPNEVKTSLQETGNDLAKSSSDGQASAPVKKAPSTLKLSLPDFCQPIQPFVVVSSIFKITHVLRNEVISSSAYHNCQERPPQTANLIS